MKIEDATADVGRAVRDVRHYFSARAWPGTGDDVGQDAAEAVLRALPSYDPELGKLAPFLFGVGRRHAGKELTRAAAVTTLHGHGASVADGGRGCRITGAGDPDREADWPGYRVSGVVMVSDGHDPEAALLAAEADRSRARLLATVRALVDEALVGMPAEEVALFRRLYGLDGEPPLKPRELAREAGVPVRRIYRARARAVTRCRESLPLWSAGAELVDLGEGR